MEISSNVISGKKVQLTSWKSPSDPSNGSFLLDIKLGSFPQVFVWKDGIPFWRSGCVRRTPLQCGRVNSTGKMDGFLKLNMMKVPDFAEDWSQAHQYDCGQLCLDSCSCVAYAYDAGAGCMSWNKSLIDTQQFYNGSGVDLYIRIANSELVVDLWLCSSKMGQQVVRLRL